MTHNHSVTRDSLLQNTYFLICMCFMGSTLGFFVFFEVTFSPWNVTEHIWRFSVSRSRQLHFFFLHLGFCVQSEWEVFLCDFTSYGFIIIHKLLLNAHWIEVGARHPFRTLKSHKKSLNKSKCVLYVLFCIFSKSFAAKPAHVWVITSPFITGETSSFRSNRAQKLK